MQKWSIYKDGVSEVFHVFTVLGTSVGNPDVDVLPTLLENGEPLPL